jgi:2-hydroxychromene-2-carboxylate isomerase
MPEPFPVNSLLALKTAFVMQDENAFEAYHEQVYRLAWAESKDIGDDAVLASCVSWGRRDPATVFQRARDSATAERLATQTAEAERRGVFGVPTIMFGEERFWGADRLELLEWRLTNRAA